MDNYFLTGESLSPWFGYLALASCSLAIIWDVSRDIRQLVSARNVFVLTLMAWYVLEMVVLPDQLLIYTQDQYDFGGLCVILSLFSFLAIYSQIRKANAFDPLFRRLAKIDNPRTIWTVFLVAIFIGFAPLLVIAKGNVLLIIDDFITPKARFSGLFQRGRYGGFRDAALELQMFLRAAIPLAAAILVDRRHSDSRRIGSFGYLVLMFLQAFNSGTRSKIVEVFLPIAAAIYWRASESLKRRLLWFGLPTMIVVGVILSAALVIGRNKGDFAWENAADANYIGFEMFRELLFISDVVPAHVDYKLGRTYYVQAINPIPRAIWPGKPSDDAGLELANMRGHVTNGEAFLTVSPGLLGEMYWNFGIVGIALISGLLGYLARSWDHARPYASRSVLAFTVFAAGLAIIFLSGRSINMATLYGLLSLFALLVLLSPQKSN